jgi:hypothetical protein
MEVLLAANAPPSKQWVLDSGASTSIGSYYDDFIPGSLQHIPFIVCIKIGDNYIAQTQRQGKVLTKGVVIMALFFASFRISLLSVPQ